MLEIYKDTGIQPNELRLVEHPIYKDRIYVALVRNDGSVVDYLLAIMKDGSGFYRTLLTDAETFEVFSTTSKKLQTLPLE